MRILRPTDSNEPRRRTSARVRAFVSAALFGWALLASGAAAAQGLDAMQEEVDGARVAYELVLDEYLGVRARFDDQAALVDRFKEQQGGIFDVFELRNGLRDLQTAADELAAIDGRLGERRVALDDESERLREAARDERSRLEARIVVASPAERTELLQRLNELSELLVADSGAAIDFEPVPIEAILEGLHETPEEMYAAADEIADNIGRLERELAELQETLADALARQRLEERSWELAVEGQLFDDSAGRRFEPRAEAADAHPTSAGRAVADEGAGGDSDGDGAFAASETNSPDVQAGATAGAADSDDSRAHGDGAVPPAAEPSPGWGFGEDPGGTDGDAESPEDPTDFGSTGTLTSIDASPLEPREASVVDVAPTADQSAGDQTLLGADGRSSEVGGRARRRTTRTAELRSAEARLVEMLEAAREERAQLLRQAEALESIE